MIGWILLGLIAGALGKLLMPGKDPGGWFITMLLGIGGAFLGGLIGNKGPGGTIPSIGSIFTATIGAVLLLVIYRFIQKKRLGKK